MRIIAGEYRGRTLKTTSGPGYRPAMGMVRQALFSMLEARGVVWPATRALDLFAGSGSLGFEALSRGAAEAVFVESGMKAAALIGETARRFGIDPARWRVHKDEVRAVLGKRCPDPFPIVFIDPPYGNDLLTPSVNALLRQGWLAAGGILNAEVEAQLPFDPETFHPELRCIADKAYGQTRVVLWTN
jgi:16S rRNA (guanine966-N2)-methyltransferase